MARYNDVTQDPVVETLKEMLDIGHIARKERRIKFQKTVMVFTANWELLIKDGLRKP